MPEPSRRSAPRQLTFLALLTLACACDPPIAPAPVAAPQPTATAVAPAPPPADALIGVTQAALGSDHSCALVGEEVYCWGRAGLLGHGDEGSLRPIRVELPPVRAIEAGAFHTCALAKDGGVWCWGISDRGQVGHAERESSKPVRLELPPARGLALAFQTSCAITTDQSIWCWGDNEGGVLPRRSAVPVKLADRRARERLICGGGTCCTHDARRLDCWGAKTVTHEADKTIRQVVVELGAVYKVDDEGRITRLDADSPPIDLEVEWIHARFGYGCALVKDGGLHCWRAKADAAMRSLAAKRGEGVGIVPVAVAPGDGHFCGIMADSSLRCWGESDHGELGDGLGDHALSPEKMAAPDGVVELALGRRATCLRHPHVEPAEEGEGGAAAATAAVEAVSCAGIFGPARKPAPAPDLLLADVRWLGANDEHICLGTMEDTRCVSAIGGPAIAHAGVTSRFGRKLAPLDLGVELRTVASGTLHHCALGADARVRCWGSAGLIRGDDDGSVLRARDAIVVGPEGVTALVSGDHHSCALADGTVHCWGHNRAGQLGRPAEPKSLPSAPVALSDVSAIAAGGESTCAVAGGEVHCWGAIAGGSAPRRIAAADHVAVGGDHACVASAGVVSCWGENDRGQLGTGDRIARDAPTPIVSTLRFDAIAAGADHTCALAAGQPYCWGDDSSHQLGRGRAVRRDEPVLVLPP